MPKAYDDQQQQQSTISDPEMGSFNNGNIDMDIGIPALKNATGKPPEPKVTWTNRRRIAWISFWAMLFIMMVSIFWLPNERLVVLSTLISTFVWSLFAIIATYMGSTSIPFIGSAKR